MKITIYGKEGCPYCVKAKQLAKELQEGLDEDVIIAYHDIQKEGLDRNNLSEIMGFEVTTVPQILIDNKPIKDGYTGFSQHINNEIAKGNLAMK